MDSSTQRISPLRRRMIDDMRMRKLSDKTQRHYIRAVRQFAGFLGRSPDTASVEDLRRYQLHLVDNGVSPVSLNAAITGLKFFFEVTLDHGELMYKMQPVRVPHTLPVVLSRQEVARLIGAAENLKHQTALSVAYGAGLRASEVVVGLKVGDIDSQRMTLRIEQGKGRKDRYAMLVPVLLERLRAWWRVAHRQRAASCGERNLRVYFGNGQAGRAREQGCKHKSLANFQRSSLRQPRRVAGCLFKTGQQFLARSEFAVFDLHEIQSTQLDLGFVLILLPERSHRARALAPSI
jgi:integrase